MSFSVATIASGAPATVITSGCAYTCPLSFTGKPGSVPSLLLTTVGERPDSLLSQPVRRLFCERVGSSARAATAPAPDSTPTAADSSARVVASAGQRRGVLGRRGCA